MNWRFDTRNKKPKLYVLIPLTLIVGILLPLWIGDGKSGVAITLVIAAYALCVTGVLLWAFKEQLRYNPYSYNTIFYFGFALYAFFVMLTNIGLAVSMAGDPTLYSVKRILQILLHASKNYIIFSVPFLFVFSVALCISNVSLIRHEGKRLVNLLGIILSFLILSGIAMVFFLEFALNGSRTVTDAVRDLVSNGFAALFLYFECMLIGAMVADAIAARHEPAKDKDYLIVLGCGLRKDGTPSPILRGRLDKALAFYEAQKKETGKELTFVTSGGQGRNEVTSESASMKRYLLEHGIQPERIIEEDRSKDTYENMLFSREKIGEITEDTKIAFSTTNYHVFRSGLLARFVKMRAVGMGAKTKWYFWPNAAVREFIGLLTKHRVKQAVILGSMILANVILSLVSY